MGTSNSCPSCREEVIAVVAAAPDDMEEEEEIDLLVNVDEQEEMETTDDEVGKIDSLAVDYATRHNMIASEVPRSC